MPIVPFWLCRLPASLPLAGDGPICSYSLSPLFREWARKCLRLELFVGKFSLSLFLSLSVYPTVWVAVSCQLPQIVLRAFRPSPYSKQCSRTSLLSPNLLVVDTSIWATSLLGVAIRHVICGLYLFIYFSSWLYCPLKFQNSPQTHW